MNNELLDFATIQNLSIYQNIYVGYSGGLDSTVLLHCLAIQPLLASKVTAIHVNHGISTHADKWAIHCQQFCFDLNITIHVANLQLSCCTNLENFARQARYKIFQQLMQINDCLLLAHHQNDQAETLLLHLLRGAGIDGLAAMPHRKALGQGHLIRPFLQKTRAELEYYARLQQLSWINDESNQDYSFARNFLRHRILPELLTRWPKAITNLSRTSEHCAQAKKNLQDLANLDYPDLDQVATRLNIDHFASLNSARIINILRSWLGAQQIIMPNSMTLHRIISEVIAAPQDAMPMVSWSNICIRRHRNYLYLIQHKNLLSSNNLLTNNSHDIKWTNFPYKLPLSNNIHLNASLSKQGLTINASDCIEIKFRQGGETFRWHSKTRSLKKLFQAWQVPPWIRHNVPLLYINKQLACVVGYAISDVFYAEHASINHVTYVIHLS